MTQLKQLTGSVKNHTVYSLKMMRFMEGARIREQEHVFESVTQILILGYYVRRFFWSDKELALTNLENVTLKIAREMAIEVLRDDWSGLEELNSVILL